MPLQNNLAHHTSALQADRASQVESSSFLAFPKQPRRRKSRLSVASMTDGGRESECSIPICGDISIAGSDENRGSLGSRGSPHQSRHVRSASCNSISTSADGGGGSVPSPLIIHSASRLMSTGGAEGCDGSMPSSLILRSTSRLSNTGANDGGGAAAGDKSRASSRRSSHSLSRSSFPSLDEGIDNVPDGPLSITSRVIDSGANPSFRISGSGANSSLRVTDSGVNTSLSQSCSNNQVSVGGSGPLPVVRSSVSNPQVDALLPAAAVEQQSPIAKLVKTPSWLRRSTSSLRSSTDKEGKEGGKQISWRFPSWLRPSDSKR